MTEDLCPPSLTIDGRALFLRSSGPTNPGPPIRTDPNTSGSFTCVYETNPVTGLVPKTTRITFTYRREKRPQGSRFCDKTAGVVGFLNSGTHDIQVFVGPVIEGADGLRQQVLADAEAGDIGWPCEDRLPPEPTVEEVALPEPGETAKVKLPVAPKSTEATVTITHGEDAVGGLAVGLTEKAKKLKKLKRIQIRLENTCHSALIGAELRDSIVLPDDEIPTVGPIHWGDPGDFQSIGVACAKLMEALQERIDELESARITNGSLGEAASCLALQTKLRLVKRKGKRPIITVVTSRKPRLELSCERTETGLELTIRRNGKGTLRQALGKNLSLTIRHSDIAPTPDPGATLSISLTQQ